MVFKLSTQKMSLFQTSRSSRPESQSLEYVCSRADNTFPYTTSFLHFLLCSLGDVGQEFTFSWMTKQQMKATKNSGRKVNSKRWQNSSLKGSLKGVGSILELNLSFLGESPATKFSHDLTWQVAALPCRLKSDGGPTVTQSCLTGRCYHLT